MYAGSNVIIIKRNKEGHGEVRGSKAVQGTKGERERDYSSNREDRKANGQSACERIEPRRDMHTREQVLEHVSMRARRRGHGNPHGQVQAFAAPSPSDPLHVRSLALLRQGASPRTPWCARRTPVT